jgi:mannose-6-phosphate isomerase-like protein (cupin superfamily)
VAEVIDRKELPFAGSSHAFVGADHGNAGISMFFVDGKPGWGPALHCHPYSETFIVDEGVATFTVDGDSLEVPAGKIVVVPAGRAHRFINSGTGRLRMTTIHVSDRFVTEWLSEESSPRE